MRRACVCVCVPLCVCVLGCVCTVCAVPGGRGALHCCSIDAAGPQLTHEMVQAMGEEGYLRFQQYACQVGARARDLRGGVGASRL